jgi:DNA-binding transcriptional MocR family regulator
MPTDVLDLSKSARAEDQPAKIVDLRRAAPPGVAALGHELQRALRDLHQAGELTALLQFNRFSGTADDRAMGAQWVGRRLGTRPPPERMIVTNGTQNALLLVMRTLLAPNDLLLAEAMTYPQLRSVAELSGIRLRGVPIDQDGVVPDAFEQICKEARPKAFYCVPTLHNPTTAVLPLERRKAIVEIARRYDVTIVEDDAQGLLLREAPPPLASIAPESVWYVLGLAKCISMGMRVGYAVAPTSELRERLLQKFGTMSMWFAAPLHAVLAASWIRDGGAHRIYDAICKDMTARHKVVAMALAGTGAETKPGALHVWLPMPAQWSVLDFVAIAQENGVLVRPGTAFALSAMEPRAHGVRICLGDAKTLDELEAGLATLARLLRTRPSKRQ